MSEALLIKCPIKSIKQFTIETVQENDGTTPVPFPGCTATLTLKNDYVDTTKVMEITANVSGDNNNEFVFTTTVAGTTKNPGRYKGDIKITNGTTIVNRDIKLD